MRAAAVTLPDSARAVPQARRLLEEVCADLGISGQVEDDVMLASTEAVTNAVRHAYPDGHGVVDLQVDRVDGVLSVTVTDYGVGLVHGPEQDPGAGAGLQIMRKLATVRHSVTQGGGSTVTLGFALRG